MNRPAHFRYWGKACASEGGTTAYHLLPYHGLDVAAVGVAYIKRVPALRGLIADAFGSAMEVEMRSWLGFHLALHDLGKFSEAFQAQRPDLLSGLRAQSPSRTRPYVVRHDDLGWMYWKEVLARQASSDEWFGLATEDLLFGADWWLRACTGHHGQPPQIEAGGYCQTHFQPTDDYAAITAYLQELFVIFPKQSLAAFASALDPLAFESASKELSWWIAGVAVLSDWLGSNTDFFPYRADVVPLTEYWEYAQERAVAALDATDVLPVRCKPTGFSDLFPSIDAPSPLQRWAATVPVGPESQIHLLEDVTGAGKTEAAVMLAHRLIANGCADGFFIGLPTMATANAMYGRIAQVYRKLFAGHASLVLAHGQRNLVEAFAESIVPSGPSESDPCQTDETATARCNAWLADHNKRALLAPAGIGTIDQALLAALYSKHQSLRLLGLFRKVLIVDEVHACDTYMRRVLETLLEFHARAGGSAILLSATLSQRMKQSLLDAFARGLGRPRAPELSSRTFPLVSSWQRNSLTVAETAVETRDDVRREIMVRYVCEESEVIAAIRSALASGKCVCWIRNTVADALAAYALVKSELRSDKLILFHARSTLRDRLDTESRILKCFGRDSRPEDRAGRLVIATQVAEQSLDADWDFVVSDLAPIDRLIQRAGRLQRHPRDKDGRRLRDPTAHDQRGQPCLWVFGPAWIDDPPAHWFKSVFPMAGAVYSHHGELWLTAQALRKGTIAMPEDARELIESVFAEDACIPSGLRSNAERAQGRAYGDESIAQQNTIKMALGYERDGADWWSEAKIPSRLGEASVTVLLARWDGKRLRPWVDHENPRHAWAYSSVRIPERLMAGRVEEAEPEREAAIQEVLQTLPGKGKWSVLLILTHERNGWIGSARTAQLSKVPAGVLIWHYDARTGLQQVDAEAGEQGDTE